MAVPFRAPRGTGDVLPEEQRYWSYVYGTASSVAATFGYERIDTPIFEDTSLFSRGVGEETEVVEKQMYSFDDLGGDSITLRPEGTANICRAYIQNGLSNRPQPVRLYYQGPFFRYERPQAGRLRQFHQFGIEAIGDPSAQADAEVIELGGAYLSALGLNDLSLKVNSIGDPGCRAGYVGELREFLAAREADLCADHRSRYARNPLRVLDCKKETCQAATGDAPRSIDWLCAACGDHWTQLLGMLDSLVEAGTLVPYSIDNRLVRGLDYYTRTVFEFEPADVRGQSTLLAGGRYDPLIETLGGRPTPGVGFGSGIERAILNLKSQEIEIPDATPLDVVGVHIGEAARREMLILASSLRALGHSVVVAPQSRGMRAQLRYASGKSARYALILGERDLQKRVATLRLLTEKDCQTEVALDAAAISEAMG